MRKEAVIFLSTTLVGLTLIANINNIFNALAGFFLSGVIPGTGVALPSLFMFSVAIIALSILIAQPIRKYLPHKYTIKAVRGKFLQIEV